MDITLDQLLALDLDPTPVPNGSEYVGLVVASDAFGRIWKDTQRGFTTHEAALAWAKNYTDVQPGLKIETRASYQTTPDT